MAIALAAARSAGRFFWLESFIRERHSRIFSYFVQSPITWFQHKFISALTALYGVIARSAMEEVIARSAMEEIIARPAMEEVIALTPFEEIVAKPSLLPVALA